MRVSPTAVVGNKVSIGADYTSVVVRPAVGIQRCVLDIPNRRSSEFVGTRAGLNLDLGVAASILGIDRSEDQFDLSDQIRIDDGGREDVITIGLRIVARVGGAQPIDRRIDGIQAQSLNGV